MKYGLIGCGRIAVNHIKAVINNNLEMIAVCDLLPEAIENLLSRTQCPQMPLRYTDYRQMVEEHPELELIAIATDSGVHAEIALYCIDHGIHVIIEKPMAMSMRDAREIVRRSQEKHVKVTVCHQNRFNIAIQQIALALEKAECCLAALPDYPIYRFGLSMNKLYDYLYSGKPVVFACCVDNVVKDSGGLVVPFGDQQTMADAIERAMAYSNDELKQIAHREKEIICTQYDYRAIAKKYLAMLERL